MARGSLDYILARTPVKDRDRVRREYEEKWNGALKAGKISYERKEAERGPKKKDGYALLNRTFAEKCMNKAIRSIATYKPKSHNRDKQVVDFVKHLFVKYPVPSFMYRCMVKWVDEPSTGDLTWRIQYQAYQMQNKDRFYYCYDIYRDWFLTLAQGGSFQKAVKGVMTKKEAVLFLAAPSDNKIHENVWWAKMKALDIPEPIIKKLLDKIYGDYFFDDPDGRLAEILHFFANNYKEIDKQEFTEIADFIVWKLRNDREFRYKGRTVTSMIKMSNEWHMQMQKAKLGQNVSWVGLNYDKWTHMTNDHLYECIELVNNKELLNEGRKQKHCVYSYVSYCVGGRTSIFSIRGFKKFFGGHDEKGEPIYNKGEEFSRITMEVNIPNRSIVQIRGNLNRLANQEEMRIIKMWAGEKGLTVSSRY